MGRQENDVLAIGRTAEVLAWKDGWMLRIFSDWFPEDAVKYEARLAEAIRAAGLPVPGVGEIIEADGRLELPYERLFGHSMLEELLSRPETLPKNAQILAELQATIHEISCVPGMPRQREQLKRKIGQAPGLSNDLARRFLRIIKRPTSDLCLAAWPGLTPGVRSWPAAG